jgi:hypothetical protein
MKSIHSKLEKTIKDDLCLVIHGAKQEKANILED